MSIPTLQGLQTALSGLLADQQAIDTTGHNITNANTEGYSRQVAVLQTNEPMRIAGALADQWRRRAARHGRQRCDVHAHPQHLSGRPVPHPEQRARRRDNSGNELQQAQSAFDEPSSAGLSSQLSAFWSAWGELADSPSSEPAKVAVVSAGAQLADTLNQVSSQLQTIKAQAGEQYLAITGPSGEVRATPTQIAQLNHQIKLSLQAKQQPNDLEDRRDLLLDKLSELGNITVTKEADGTDTVAFGNAAKPLVEGSEVNWPQALTTAAGGKLGALLELRAPQARSANTSDALERRRRNARRARSTDCTPPRRSSPAPPPRRSPSRSNARSADRKTGPPGGNEIALAIAGLRGGSAEQRYAALIAQVGSDVQSAKSNADQRAGRRHRGQRPAPERLGRLPGRRNDQPHYLPARL